VPGDNRARDDHHFDGEEERVDDELHEFDHEHELEFEQEEVM